MNYGRLTELTLPGIADEVRALYYRSPVGCCLHIVLDDGNVSDDNVQYCVELARERGHAECELLAVKLSFMSKTQRSKARKFALRKNNNDSRSTGLGD